MEKEDYTPDLNTKKIEIEDNTSSLNKGKKLKIIISLIVGILIVGGFFVYSKYSEGSFFTEKIGFTAEEGQSSFDTIIQKAKKDGTNPHFLIENMSGTELFKVEHGGNVYLAELKNCDTFDTDANGKLTCGTDYDTNVTTICSGDEVLLGNSTCFSVVDIDTDTTYTAGSNLSLDATVFSLDETNVEAWLDTLYFDEESDLTTLLDDNYANIQWDYNQSLATYTMWDTAWSLDTDTHMGYTYLALTNETETFDENVIFSKNISQGDDDYHVFGTDADSYIYFNGSNLIISG